MADKEPTFLGNVAFFRGADVPERYKEELDLILDNSRKIQGENFVRHVKFVVNLKSLIGMIMSNTEPIGKVDKDTLAKTLAYVSHQLTCSHANALGLSEAQDKEAFKVTEAMDSITTTMQNEINKKYGGRNEP